MSGRANRKEGRKWTLAAPPASSAATALATAAAAAAEDQGESLARTEDFPIPCSAFRCSLICRALFLPGRSRRPRGLSAFTRAPYVRPPREPRPASPVQPAPIRGALCWGLGSLSACSPSGALHPPDSPPSPTPHRLPFPRSPPSLFLRLLRLPLSSLPRASVSPQGAMVAKGLLLPQGRLCSLGCTLEHKLTGAPFRRWPPVRVVETLALIVTERHSTTAAAAAVSSPSTQVNGRILKCSLVSSSLS